MINFALEKIAKHLIFNTKYLYISLIFSIFIEVKTFYIPKNLC